MIMTSLLTARVEDIGKILDCTEGLENRIKALLKDTKDLETLVAKITTKRYSSARIRRIMLSCLLKINAELVKECLSGELYAKVLAVRSSSKDLIAKISQKGSIPILTRKSDLNLLKKTALKCYGIDSLANDLYNLATENNFNENYMVII